MRTPFHVARRAAPKHAISGWLEEDDGVVGWTTRVGGVRVIYAAIKLGRRAGRFVEWWRARPRWHRGDRPRAGR